jgi:hypothetical protein
MLAVGSGATWFLCTSEFNVQGGLLNGLALAPSGLNQTKARGRLKCAMRRPP